MTELTTFTSDKESLQDILKAIKAGKYQLPEFQRGWVWDDNHIISLLASVSLSYPIGAVMMLENGNPEVRFKPRPVEGVDLGAAIEPERFVLDGQQRLTSLFQALFMTTAVRTRDIRKREISRWYYIDMQMALSSNGDREDAIRSLPEDRIYALLMRDGCLDFRTGVPIEVQSYFSDAIDIHHIFPRAWCQKNNIEARFYDSIINKTALSDRTNRMIGGNAPAVYLQTICERESIDEQRQDEILASHVIDASDLKANDFQAFYAARKGALLSRIEKATGKTIARMADVGLEIEPLDGDDLDMNDEAA